MSLETALWLAVFATAGLSSLGLSMRFLSCSKTLVVIPIVWGMVIWGLTEGLSLAGGLTANAVSIFWLIAAASLLFLALRFQGIQYLSRQIITSLRWFSGLAFFYRLLGCGVIAIWLVTFILAIVSPPNNWDSMTYHLPRVMNWIQNESVEYYVTGNARQVVQPPLSSYATLQSIITTRQDYLVNLIQWLAGIWCLFVVAAIAKSLKVCNGVAMLAVFFAATIPIGIAESTTTQNEWLMSLWTLLMAYVWLSFNSGRFSFKFVTTASGGLMFCAAATKQLSLIFAGVFFTMLLITIFFRRGFFHGVVAASVGTLGASMALAPQFARNYLSFGSFVGDPEILEILDANRVGVARNAVAEPFVHSLFNIPVPGFLPIEQIGDFLGDPFGYSTQSFLSLWGLDRFLPFPGLQLHEDSAASPITFFLGLTAVAWFFWRYPTVVPRAYSLATLLLFFGIFFTVSAREGSNRYLLTAMLLASVPLAIWLNALGTKVLYPVSVLTLSYSLVFVFFLEYRPILPNFEVFTSSREDLYFKARPELLAPYQAFAKEVHPDLDGPQLRIGVVQGYDDWEYPVWILSGAPWEARILHLGVLPSSERIDPEEQLSMVDVVFDTYWKVEPETTRLGGSIWQ